MVSRALAIIPAFNEEDALPGVLKELRATPLELDVLVIDDGSGDRTAIVARELGARVAELPFNLGIGSALRTGFRFAARNSYEYVVQVDADGQHDPSEISKLIAPLESGADMVIGSRFSEGAGGYEVGRVRWQAMKILRVLIRALSGRNFTDSSSGFRGFGRSAIDLFALNYPMDFMDSVESLLVASYAGLNVVEVPVRFRQRLGGMPSNRNFKLIYHFARLMIILLSSASIRQRRRSRRLR
jgi:glycosyltransferase involved in cell wall biosynthesis